MTPEEWFEEHERRLTGAELRSRQRLAKAAAGRDQARARHAELMVLVRDARRGSLAAGPKLREALRRLARSWGPRPSPNRRGRPDVEDGGVPVRPDRPLNLSGGAAAELDFENE